MGAQVAERAMKNAEELKPLSKRERELRDAVERVYRRYGNDLNAFYRDAHREAQKEQDKKTR